MSFRDRIGSFRWRKTTRVAQRCSVVGNGCRCWQYLSTTGATLTTLVINKTTHYKPQTLMQSIGNYEQLFLTMLQSGPPLSSSLVEVLYKSPEWMNYKATMTNNIKRKKQRPTSLASWRTMNNTISENKNKTIYEKNAINKNIKFWTAMSSVRWRLETLAGSTRVIRLKLSKQEM